MRSLCALAWLLSSAFALAASYPDAEAKNHVGATAEVHGKVFDVHVSQSGLILINFGAKFPAQTFTAVIFKEHAPDFPAVEKLDGATLSVTGLLKKHREKVEMVLEKPEQLKVLAAAPASAFAAATATPALAEKTVATVVGPDGVTRRILPFSRELTTTEGTEVP